MPIGSATSGRNTSWKDGSSGGGGCGRGEAGDETGASPARKSQSHPSLCSAGGNIFGLCLDTTSPAGAGAAVGSTAGKGILGSNCKAHSQSYTFGDTFSSFDAGRAGGSGGDQSGPEPDDFELFRQRSTSACSSSNAGGFSSGSGRGGDHGPMSQCGSPSHLACGNAAHTGRSPDDRYYTRREACAIAAPAAMVHRDEGRGKENCRNHGHAPHSHNSSRTNTFNTSAQPPLSPFVKLPPASLAPPSARQTTSGSSSRSGDAGEG